MSKLTTLIALIAAGVVVTPAAGASSAADPVPQPRVVGGAIDETPGVEWLAALNHQGFYVCSGSLVSPRFVITAAHCTRGTRARQWTVRLGSRNRTDAGHVRRVRRILEFPGYIPILDYGDLALLSLRAPVPIEPIKLVPRGTHWTGEDGYIAGWGQTTASIHKAPRLLHSAWIRIRRHRICKRQYGWGFDAKVMICAGGLDTSACIGDSGGPLARLVDGAWQLLGVTSFGKARCNRPGGYAWIGSKPLRRWLHSRLGA